MSKMLVADPSKLTPKERAFVLEHLIDYDRVRAINALTLSHFPGE